MLDFSNGGKMNCKICSNKATLLPRTRDADDINCPYCGRYSTTGSFDIDSIIDKSNFYKVSSWIREQNDEFNNHLELNYDNFEDILNSRDK